jgi:eukaryotic-like serine/threonine-protein kinase
MVMESLARLDPPRRLGKLTLLARLGEGGMATVHVAAIGQGALARLAAVKLMRADVAGHDYRTRFLDEARVVARLHHNNLVDVREAGEHDGQLYIAMELIEGRDLADVWDRCAAVGRAFPIALAVYVVREILRGLHYAHTFPGLGLVHRDVSPSNILVDWSGAVRLADFGLATSALKASLTVPGMVFGKVGYMAPEQASRRELDGRADLYGCGVVLWELLTGRPLRGEGADTSAVASFVAPSPSAHSKRVDPQLDRIVSRALARKREDRWDTAADFMRALSDWLAEHAPQTNQETVADFMQKLFGDARERDHEVHSELMERASRVGTLAFAHPDAADAESSSQAAAAGDVRAVTTQLRDTELVPAGHVIADRYRIEHAMGQGGMGTVYLAEHLTVGRKVAVKVLTHEWSRHDIVARRFKEEARAASAAGHPNIVEVFDAGRLSDGRLYIAMEHLTGRSLYEEVQALGPLSLDWACRIVRDVARATKAAHEVGIIHRDLKPDNVMIVTRGDEKIVKVLDFGISASAERAPDEERLTRPGHCLGTPEYMAPEQAKGFPSTEQFDIYALGVLLFEALTGDPPFVSENVIELLRAKATRPAPSLEACRPDAPRALVKLVADCLQIQPEERPASVGVLIDRLEGILRALPRTQPLEEAVVAPPSGTRTPVSESVPAARRRRIIVGTSAGLGALVIAALWWRAVPADNDGARTSTSQVVHAGHLPARDFSEAARRSAEPDAVVTEQAAALVDAGDDRVDTESVPEGADEAQTDGASSGIDESDDRPAHLTPACRRVRAAAAGAVRKHDWSAALRHLRSSKCWGAAHRDDYAAFRVRALFETRQFDKCARAGSNSTDREVRQVAEACRQRRRRGSN